MHTTDIKEAFALSSVIKYYATSRHTTELQAFVVSCRKPFLPATGVAKLLHLYLT